jgi:hypothetical protein
MRGSQKLHFEGPLVADVDFAEARSVVRRNIARGARARVYPVAASIRLSIVDRP